MEIRILKEEELVNAAGLSRYVFDNCLRNRMEFPQTTAYVESYVSYDNLKNMQKEGKLTLWGAFEQEQLVAVSGLQSDGMITMVYVLPQISGRGIGSELLLTMREYAWNVYGLKKVSLNAVPAWTSFYFLNQGFSYVDPKHNMRVPFIPMYALSDTISNQKKNPITAKTIIWGLLGCLGITTLVGCLYMLIYIF